MWQFSGVPEDPGDETVMEMHSADVLHSAAKSSMHAIRSEDQDTQLDAAHRIIQFANPWTMRRWSESNLANINSWFGYRRTQHTLFISNELKTSKGNSRCLWRDTLHGVRWEHGGYIDGACHVSHWYWETLRIGMMFLDNGTMNGDSTLGWILSFSDG